MEKLFRKARQNRIFQDVVSQIQSVILDGKLKPGQKLPSERELGETFGISRGTLREALRVLEQKGLIKIRLGVGGGAIIRDTGAEQISDNLAILIRNQKVSLQHLAEFREDVEGSVTGLAAKKSTKKDIERLRELLDQARKYHDQGIAEWEQFVRVDEQMHTEVAKIAGNPLYTFILQTVHDNIFLYYERFLTASEAELKENYADLRRMVKAIENHDPEEARRIARNHVRRFNRHMRKKARSLG